MNSLRRFKSQCEANVAILFAMSIVPMVAAAGMAVDYSRAAARRAALQGALDTALRSVARKSGLVVDTTALRNVLTNSLTENFGTGFTIESFINTSGAFTATVSAAVPTTLMKVVGIKTMPIRASATATMSREQIVLVLDSSSHLNTTKRDALRTAVNNFIDKVASTGGSIEIGVMPYAVSARVNETTYASANWILFPTQPGAPPPVEVCEEVPNPPPPPSEDGEDGEDGGTSGGTGTTTVCHWEYPPAPPANPWDGCITDRPAGLDINDAPHNSDNARKYPAILDCRAGETNLADAYPLTTNFADLKSRVQSLQGGGGANMTIGVSWGHAMLSSIEPFLAGNDPRVRKIMVLVSAGPSTESGILGAGNTQDNYNLRTTAACSSARASGIEIHTVNFQTSPSAAQVTMLQGCASNGNYHDASGSSSIGTVFTNLSSAMRHSKLTK